MAIKRKHHYVPKLYLKQFASKPRRIHVCVLGTRLYCQDVGLKDQCQRPRLYGKTDDLENDLMKLETLVAPTIDSVVNTSSLPEAGSIDHANLLLFTAFQAARTPFAIAGMSDGFEKLYENVTAHGRGDVRDLEQIKMQHDESVLQSLKNASLVASYWADLEMHLSLNKTENPFFTSDNPVVLYNQYCEGLKGMGTTGAIRRGLQVFVPISPRHLLVLYDKLVYTVGAKNADSTEVYSEEDSRTLNILQVANADEILLFSEWNKVNVMKRIVSRATKYRRQEISHLEEFVSEDDPEHDSLLQIYPVPLNVKLQLSFLKLRRKAQAVPLRQRALEYRVDIRPGFAGTRQQGGKGPGTRFVRKNPA
jgi:hypothetical protein